MNHLDLFSGIGGFALACEWAGIETIGFVEIDKFCQKVLKKHWPGVPCIEDVNNVEEIKQVITNATDTKWRPGQFGRAETPVRAAGDDQSSRDDSLLLTAGFPCQPFSNAGRKRGEDDNRYLWPQTFAVIEAVKPDWIILENVPGILGMVFPDSKAPVASQATFCEVPNDDIADYDTISGGIDRNLRSAGYETVWLVIPACGLGAPHRRDRVWIVANRSGIRCDGGQHQGQGIHSGNETCREVRTSDQSKIISSHSPDTQREGLERSNTEGRTFGRPSAECCDIPGWEENWYEVATRFCRVDARIPDRVDRLKSLGNAIVPQVAYQLIKNIVEIENEKT